MALFIFQGLDKAEALELRKATREAHLAWIAALDPRVKIGGPMLSDDGAMPIGSMLVVEADTLADAKALFAQDPYALASLWQSTSVRPYNWLIRQ
jgi:uncharacterized protein YciI